MKNILIVITVILSWWMVSCESFLTEDPKGQLASVNFFKSRNDLDLAMHRLYYQIAVYGNNNEHFPSYSMGADLSCRGNLSGGQRTFDDFTAATLSGSDSYTMQEWQYLYMIIKNANFIINYAGTSPVDQTTLDAYLAQAYFWRAWSYFNLVTTWGPVPIVLDEVVNYDASISSIEDVWTKVILPDIEKAELAPDMWSNISGAAAQSKIGNNAWVTKAAAKAAAAYIYLSYAGFPNNKTDYYAKAAAKAKEVIDGCQNGIYPYRLHDEYWKIYGKTLENNNVEALLCVYYSKYAGSGAMDTWDPLMGPGDVAKFANADGTGAVSNGGSWGEFAGEIKFWKEFPDGPRKDATYAPKTLIQNEDGSAALVDWWDERRDVENRQPWFTKMLILTTNNSAAYKDFRNGEWDYTRGFTGVSGTTGDHAHPMIQLGEVYCWYAEAVARSGQGDKAKAVELLNAVRNRADGQQSDIYAVGLSNEELAEAAYKEHGWEISGLWYGSFAPQYFDMFRLNKVQEHFNYRVQNPGIEVAPGIICKEPVTVTGSWSESLLYAPYNANDAGMNPNLHR